jgi:hypothetical protein
LVEITTVDRVSRRVEVKLKDGGIVNVPVWNIPTLFRWPKTGEKWIIRQDGGQWKLEESTDPAIQMRDGDRSEEQAISLEDLNEGEARLTATHNAQGSGVWINNHQAARKVSFTLGDGVETEYEVKHNMHTMDAQTTVLRKEGEDVSMPVITVEDQDTVTLTWTVAPPIDSVRVIITG